MNIEQIIRDYLPQVIHMSLATTANNKPWISEVHYAYDESLNFYFRSLQSRRHSQEIAHNQSVAGNIVKQFTLGEAPVGVYFEGIARVLAPGEEQREAFEAIQSRFDSGENTLEEAKRPEGHQFYKITVDTFYVFGKFSDQGSKKYELKWNKAI